MSGASTRQTGHGSPKVQRDDGGTARNVRKRGGRDLSLGRHFQRRPFAEATLRLACDHAGAYMELFFIPFSQI